MAKLPKLPRCKMTKKVLLSVIWEMKRIVMRMVVSMMMMMMMVRIVVRMWMVRVVIRLARYIVLMVSL